VKEYINALLITYDWIIDLLKVNGTLLLDKKKLEKENKDFLTSCIHISDTRFKGKILHFTFGMLFYP